MKRAVVAWLLQNSLISMLGVDQHLSLICLMLAGRCHRWNGRRAIVDSLISNILHCTILALCRLCSGRALRIWIVRLLLRSSRMELLDRCIDLFRFAFVIRVWAILVDEMPALADLFQYSWLLAWNVARHYPKSLQYCRDIVWIWLLLHQVLAISLDSSLDMQW